MTDRQEFELQETSLQQIHGIGGDKLLREMIEIFLRSGAERLTSARQALTSGDLDAVGYVAHSLRSSAGNLGGLQLSEVAAELESLAREGQLERVRERFSRLEEIYRQMETLLQQRLLQLEV